ncbi:MAG: glycine cleavage system protein GcvH [Kiloniellales bacterium]
MSERKYTEDHEWILVEGDIASVGISDHAQEQLGDVVYIDLPEKGAELAQGAEAATVESVKAASEIYAPVGGEVVEVNAALNDDPAIVNSDPYGDGWIFKLKLADAGELDKLMDESAYKEYVESLQ